MMNKFCAIHQPNFFPWLGYFDKIAKADVFVFLDHVQFCKQTWTTRVPVDDHNQAKWLSCPVVFRFGDRITKVEIKDFKELERYVIQRARSIYRNTPYFKSLLEFLEDCFSFEQPSLSLFNQSVIRKACVRMGLEPQFFLESEMGLAEDLKSNDLLIEICHKLKAQVYICGGGAAGYQSDDLFIKQGIELRYQDFSEPKYKNSELRGLSILDSITCVGWEEVARMIRGEFN